MSHECTSDPGIRRDWVPFDCEPSAITDPTASRTPLESDGVSVPATSSDPTLAPPGGTSNGLDQSDPSRHVAQTVVEPTSRPSHASVEAANVTNEGTPYPPDEPDLTIPLTDPTSLTPTQWARLFGDRLTLQIVTETEQHCKTRKAMTAYYHQLRPYLESKGIDSDLLTRQVFTIALPNLRAYLTHAQEVYEEEARRQSTEQPVDAPTDRESNRTRRSNQILQQSLASLNEYMQQLRVLPPHLAGEVTRRTLDEASEPPLTPEAAALANRLCDLRSTDQAHPPLQMPNGQEMRGVQREHPTSLPDISSLTGTVPTLAQLRQPIGHTEPDTASETEQVVLSAERLRRLAITGDFLERIQNDSSVDGTAASTLATALVMIDARQKHRTQRLHETMTSEISSITDSVQRYQQELSKDIIRMQKDLRKSDCRTDLNVDTLDLLKEFTDDLYDIADGHERKMSTFTTDFNKQVLAIQTSNSAFTKTINDALARHSTEMQDIRAYKSDTIDRIPQMIKDALPDYMSKPEVDLAIKQGKQEMATLMASSLRTYHDNWEKFADRPPTPSAYEPRTSQPAPSQNRTSGKSAGKSTQPPPPPTDSKTSSDRHRKKRKNKTSHTPPQAPDGGPPDDSDHDSSSDESDSPNGHQRDTDPQDDPQDESSEYEQDDPPPPETKTHDNTSRTKKKKKTKTKKTKTAAHATDTPTRSPGYDIKAIKNVVGVFEGRTKNLEDYNFHNYSEKFERYMRVNNVDYEHWASILLLTIEFATYNAIADLPAEHRDNYELLKEKLLHCYPRPFISPHMYQALWMNITQGHDESIESYASRIDKIAFRANIGVKPDALDGQKILKFRLGLHREQLRLQLQCRSDLVSFHDVVAAAVAMDAETNLPALLSKANTKTQHAIKAVRKSPSTDSEDSEHPASVASEQRKPRPKKNKNGRKTQSSTEGQIRAIAAQPATPQPLLSAPQPPQNYYQPPPQNYAPPPQNYVQPPQQYAPPPQQHAQPPQQYAQPPQNYNCNPLPPPNQGQPPPNQQRREPRADGLARFHQGANPANYTCFNCYQYGHIASECNNPRVPNPRNQQQPRINGYGRPLGPNEGRQQPPAAPNPPPQGNANQQPANNVAQPPVQQHNRMIAGGTSESSCPSEISTYLSGDSARVTMTMPYGFDPRNIEQHCRYLSTKREYPTAPIVPIKVATHEVIALCDSAASLTTVSPRLAKLLERANISKIEQTSERVQAFDNRTVTLKAIITVPFSTDYFEISIKAYVVPDTSFDIALGNDFFEQTKANMDWETKLVRLGHVVTPFLTTAQVLQRWTELKSWFAEMERLDKVFPQSFTTLPLSLGTPSTSA